MRKQSLHEILQDAVEFHHKFTKKFIHWEKEYIYFPKTCFLSGQSTGWFTTVWHGVESSEYHDVLRRRNIDANAWIGKKEYWAREDQFLFAKIKNDPRLMDDD